MYQFLKWALMFCLCVVAKPAIADESSVEQVWFEKGGDAYIIRVDFNLEAADKIEKLLQGGYEVHFQFELLFMQRKDWWRDQQVADIEWKAKLSYDSLLESYFLSDKEKEKRFSTLQSALIDIAQLKTPPLNDTAFVLLFEQEDIYIQARLLMPVSHLPTPIQISLILDRINFRLNNWQNFDLEIR